MVSQLGIVTTNSNVFGHFVQFFEELYDIEVNEDVNRVLIALPQSRNSDESSDIMKDLSLLESIAKNFTSWGNGPNLRDIMKDLKRLK